MARRQLFLLAFLIYNHVHLNFGESVQVIVGDAVTFPATDKCQTDKPAKVWKVGHSDIPVASREEGVWKPERDYADRVVPNSSFAFNRTLFTDSGLYELRCNGSEHRIQLDVFVSYPVPLTEAVPGKFPCYFSAAAPDKAHAIRWERNGATVLEQNLSTGVITYGTGFSGGKVGLSPNGKKEGEWSLILHHPQMEDKGIYFCYVLENGLKEKWGQPAAVSVKVAKKKSQDQTTTPQPLTTGGSTTHDQNQTGNGPWMIFAIIEFVIIVALVSLLLRRPCLQLYRRARKSFQSGGGRRSDMEEPFTGEPSSSNNGLNGVNGVTKTSSSHAETSL